MAVTIPILFEVGAEAVVADAVAGEVVGSILIDEAIGAGIAEGLAGEALADYAFGEAIAGGLSEAEALAGSLSAVGGDFTAAEVGSLLSEGFTQQGLTSLATEGVSSDVISSLASRGMTEEALTSAISQGATPDLLATVNATADPIASMNAAMGWTASDPAYLMDIGYTGLVVNPVTGMATPVDTLLQAQAHGWESLAADANAPAGAQFQDSMGTYFNSEGEIVGQATRGVAYQPPSNFTPVAGQGPAGSAYIDQAGTYYDAAGHEIATGGPMSAGPGPQFNGPAVGANSNIVAGTEIGHQIPGAYSVDASGTYYNFNGDPVAYTQANGGVVGTNGLQYIEPTSTAPLTELNAQQTAELMKNVDPNMVNSLQPVEPVPGETPYRVEVTGAAGTAEAPQYAVTEAMTPGSQLATQAEIDAGTATWNPTANAWEVGATTAELSPITPVEIPAGSSTIPAGVDLTAPAAVSPEVATLASSVPPEVLATANATADPLGSLIEQMGWTPGATATAAGAVALSGAGAGAGGGAGAAEVAGATAPVAPAPVAPTPVATTPVATAPVVEPPLSPVEPVTITPSQPIPEVTATTPPVDNLPPVVDLSRPALPMGPSPYDWVLPAAGGVAAGVIGAGLLSGGGGGGGAGTGGPANPPQFGKLGDLVNPGLNPGWINPQPMYQTTSPVQSQYYWGVHPYAYDYADLANYNKVPNAPATPWGVQQAISPFDVNQFIRTTINPQSQAAAAGTAPQYYAPYAPATPITGVKV